MQIEKLFDADEQPLDHLLPDGGFCGIFRKIGCIGDSLSSGEFEATGERGQKTYHDMFDYSWGQYIARAAGTTVYNFSRGGMTAKEYMESFAASKDFFALEKACQAYIIALGVNDISRIIQGSLEFGDPSDISTTNMYDNKPTFAGYYARIIQQYKAIQPDAFFFLMTIPNDPDADPKRRELEDKLSDLIFRIADMFPNTFVLDFRRYAPLYDQAFRKNFFLGNHMNPCGYVLTAKMVMSYIDYIIRHNMSAFKQVAFMGTPWKNTTE